MKNIFFSLLASGIFYLIFLIIVSNKIYSGFLMQIVLFLDAVKSHNSLSLLIFSQDFAINLFSGFFLLFLIIKLIIGVYQSINQIFKTRKIISNLKITQPKNNYLVFKSNNQIAFTSGFINPKVYLSNSILKKYSSSEFKAIFYHELNHQKNHDPIKNFIINFIKLILPYFPGKNWLFKKYFTLVEINCDQSAELKLRNKKPLISALLKIQTAQPNLFINYFSNQSDRIKILVGKKTLNFKNILLFNSFILTTFLFSSVFISKSNIFYDCKHLYQCVQNLLSKNDHSVLIQQLHTYTSLKDHCNNPN